MTTSQEFSSRINVEQQQAIFLRVPNEILSKLSSQVFFKPMMQALSPLFLEWDILGSRYDAMIELVTEESNSFAQYPLYEQVKQKLHTLRVQGVIPDAVTFTTFLEQLIEETQQQMYPDDSRSNTLLLRLVLTLYFNGSPEIPARSAENIALEKTARRQTFFARFGKNREAYISYQAEMSRRAAEVRKQKTEEQLSKIVPIIKQGIADGHSYDEIAITLNEQGFKTLRGLPFTRPRIDEALAGQGNISREAAKNRNQILASAVLPIIEEKILANYSYQDIAAHLNSLGYKPPLGEEFNREIVGYMAKQGELPSPLQPRIERQKEIKESLYDLLDALPSGTVLETQQMIQQIQQLRKELGLVQFREEFLDHPNFSFTFTEARWNAPIFMPIIPLVHEQIKEWTGLDTLDEPALNMSTLSEVIEQLIKYHPLNGSLYKITMYEELSEVLSVIFGVFHHPFAEYLKPEHIKHYLITSGKNELIIQPSSVLQQEFRPQGTGVRIPISEIQNLLNQRWTKEEVAEFLSEKYQIEIKISALSILLDRGSLVYTRQKEIDAELELQERLVFAQIARIEEIQEQLQEVLLQIPFEELSEEQKEQWLKVVHFPKSIRSLEQVFQRMHVKFGSNIQVLQEALEDGVLPAKSFALLVGERFKSNAYFHLSEKVWQEIEQHYGISPQYVEVEGKLSYERVGIMDVGEFVQQMADFLMSESRSKVHLFQNQGDFYQELADRIASIFTVGVHPFATVVNTAGLFVAYKDSSLNEKILTSSSIWKVLFRTATGSVVSLDDILLTFISQRITDNTWPTSNREKLHLVESVISEQLVNAVALTDDDLTVELLLKYLQKYQSKLVTKLNNVQKSVMRK